jgi:hypothetical protein
MNLDDYLESMVLVDCSGITSHRVTLLPDGRVRVRMGEVEAVIDPHTRSISPPSRQLGRGEYTHAQIIEMACSIGRR